jgi:hypothetical protein
MKFNTLFWATFRVCYCVDAIFWVAVLCLRTFPPSDGNIAKAFGGALAVNTLTVIIFWCFVPESWWNPKKSPPKPPPPTPDFKQDLEEVSGQQSLEDFLEKRRACGTER